MESHLDIAQVTHFPKQISGIHDSDTKAVQIQSCMSDGELGRSRTQKLFPVLSRPLPIHLSVLEYLALHEPMDLGASLPLRALIAQHVEISQRLIEASQLLLKRLPLFG